MRRWQRASLALACVEILAGLAVGLGGCVKSLATDASLALVGAVFALGAGIVALVIPGVLLLAVGHPARWLAQTVPFALTVMLLVMLARG